MSRPKYAPRDRLVSRPSSDETKVVDDFAATTLERPILSLEDFERRFGQPARAVRPPVASPLAWLPLVVLSCTIAGLAFGAVLALV